MFTGFSDDTIQFLLDLRFHNHTSFFHENHDQYVESVQKPFYELIESLSPVALDIDPEMEVRPHKCLSRIHRDTRFSRDKSPYRDHQWFLFRKKGEPRENSVFFYGEFGPGRLDWGMGVWGEGREMMDCFRKKIAANPERIMSIIDGMDLPKRDLALGGRYFKRIEIPDSVPEKLIRWYSARDLYIGKMAPAYELAFSEKLVREMEKDFIVLAPMYRLLNGIREELKDEQ